MDAILSYLVSYLLLALWTAGSGFVCGLFAYWFWWAMGSPQTIKHASILTPAKAARNGGLLLSALGRIVVDGYNRVEARRHNERIAELQNSGILIEDGNNVEARVKYEYLASNSKLNFYKAAGACIFCLTPYFTAIVYLLLSLVMPLPLWVLVLGGVLALPISLTTVKSKL